MTRSLMARSAPLRDGIVEEIDHLLKTYVPDGEVPPDGHDRVDYRLGIVLSVYDDDDPDNPAQPVTDALTDLLHLCAWKGWDIDYLIEKAEHMRQEEIKDWGEL